MARPSEQYDECCTILEGCPEEKTIVRIYAEVASRKVGKTYRKCRVLFYYDGRVKVELGDQDVFITGDDF